jgi:hypothetical protein
VALRLTGLPASARYPDVAIGLGDEFLDLVFSGGDAEHAVQIPLRLLGADDDESAALDLAAKLKAMGYAVTLRT